MTQFQVPAVINHTVKLYDLSVKEMSISMTAVIHWVPWRGS